MNLTEPLADIASPGAAAILRRLALLEAPTSGRRIALLAGVPPRRAVAVFHDLLEIGLVNRERVGQAWLYRLNRRHLYWSPIEAILSAPSTIESLIDSILTEHADPETSAAVFGSFARREAGRGSDIDLLVVWSDQISPEAREATIAALTDAVEPLTGNRLGLLELAWPDLERMARSGEPILRSWLHEARVVHGPDLRPRIRELIR